MASQPKGFLSLFFITLNLIPLFGVLFLGWSAAQIFLLYWVETLMAALFLIPRIQLSIGSGEKAFRLIISTLLVVTILSLFWFVAIAMIYVDYKIAQPELVAETQISDWIKPSLIGAIAIFCVSYGFLLFKDYSDGTLKSRPISFDITAVMGRLIIIQTIITAATYMILANELPLFVTLVLVIGKILLDLLLLGISYAYPHLISLMKRMDK